MVAAIPKAHLADRLLWKAPPINFRAAQIQVTRANQNWADQVQPKMTMLIS